MKNIWENGVRAPVVTIIPAPAIWPIRSVGYRQKLDICLAGIIRKCRPAQPVLPRLQLNLIALAKDIIGANLLLPTPPIPADGVAPLHAR